MTLQLGRHAVADDATLMMAIVNRTPDSFYDRGATWAEDAAFERVARVVAEGAEHNATSLERYFTEHAERLGFDLRVTKLGHIQRGGSPRVFDRLSATLLGAAAVEHLQGGIRGVLLGIIDGKVTATPLASAVGMKKPLDARLADLACVLAE